MVSTLLASAICFGGAVCASPNDTEIGKLTRKEMMTADFDNIMCSLPTRSVDSSHIGPNCLVHYDLHLFSTH